MSYSAIIRGHALPNYRGPSFTFPRQTVGASKVDYESTRDNTRISSTLPSLAGAVRVPTLSTKIANSAGWGHLIRGLAGFLVLANTNTYFLTGAIPPVAASQLRHMELTVPPLASSVSRVTLSNPLPDASPYTNDIARALNRTEFNSLVEIKAALSSAAEAGVFLRRLGHYVPATLMRVSDEGCFTVQWRDLKELGLLLVFSGDGEPTYAMHSAERNYAEWTLFDVNGPAPAEVLEAFRTA